MRAFEVGRRAITRDPRRGHWSMNEFNRKHDQFKMQYFMPAVMIAAHWEASKGQRDPAITARVEELHIRLSQLRTDMHNLKLERERSRVAAQNAGPPVTDTDSDDSTYMPPAAGEAKKKKKKDKKKSTLKSVVVVASAAGAAAITTPKTNDNAWKEADKRRSVFERIDGPSTSDGRGRDRSYSPIRSAVYSNSNVRNKDELSWSEAEKQQTSAGSEKRFKLAWNGQNRRLCPCCGDDVWIGKCRKFRWLSLSQRLQLVDEHRLCHNCFRFSHKAENCRNKEGAMNLGCFKCNGEMHNSVLCPKRNQ